MIHGMWCSPWVWQNFKKPFEEEGFVCIAPSLRHHGKSLPPNSQLGTTSLLDYISDLKKEIRAIELEHGSLPIIMGHSMGGLLAQMLASRNLAKALILLAPAAPSGVFALRMSVVKIFIDILTQESFWKKPVKIDFKRASWGLFNRIPEDEQADLYRNLCHESGLATFQAGMSFIDKKKTTRLKPKKVDCPVFTLVGEYDRITPPSVAKSISRLYRESFFLKLPDHAHWLLAEPGWEKVTDELLIWIKNYVH